MISASREIKNRLKLSLMGSIPKDWSVKQLKDCSEFITKGATPTTYGFAWEKSGIVFLRSECVTERGIDLKAAMFISEEADRLMQRSSIKSNDILMTITGNVGRVCMVPKAFPRANINQHIARIRIIEREINVAYVFQFLNQESQLKEYLKITTGQAYPQLSLEQVRSTRILTPPLWEQTALANLLSTWDRAIDLTSRLITQKELQKKWLMQQLLLGKKRLPAFAKAMAGKKGVETEWKKSSYGDLLQVVKRSVEWDDNALYHLVSVRRRSGGVFERESLYGRQILVKDLRIAREGDFLFSKMQIVHGASSLVPKKFDGAMISGSYIAVVARDQKELSMEFFDWYSRIPYFYHQTYISSYGVHIEKMTFDFESFLSLDMKLPPMEEQMAITSTLSTCERELLLLRQKLEKLKEQKKGLMQVLLTGKKRLMQAR